MNYTSSSSLCHVVSIYIWLWHSISKTLGVVTFFSCTFRSTFRREAPFGNEVYFLKFLTSCSFRIYMVMAVHLQNPRSGCLFFPAPSGAPSGGRRPLEMKYASSSSLRHVVSEYIWLWQFISKTLGVVACFFPAPSGAPSGGRCPLEMKYSYSSSLRHVVSEYIWLWQSISKSLGVVACFFLHLQEGGALWK